MTYLVPRPESLKSTITMIISTILLPLAFVSTVIATPLIWHEIAVPAKPNQFPWMVRMEAKPRHSSYYNFCGGFLIRNPTNKKDQSDLVMTAAHCIVDGGHSRKYRNDSQSWILALGAHARTEEIEKSQGYNTSEKYHVKGMLYHPKWRQPRIGHHHDIALIQLDRPAMFSQKVQPLDLPKKGELLQAGDKCQIAGWGALSISYDAQHETKLPDTLMTANVSISSDADCNADWMMSADEIKNTDVFYCADTDEAPSALCSGDSGGPLFHKNNKDKWVVHGVISSTGGLSCGEGRTGRQLVPDKYVKVEANLDWIEKTIREWNSQEN